MSHSLFTRSGRQYLTIPGIKKYCSNIILLLVLITVFRCTIKKDTIPQLTGQLYFHFHTNIDDTEVPGYDSIVRSSAGRKISLGFTQLYISNIKLVKQDGSAYSVPDKVLLKTFWNELYLVGNIPAGNYKSVQFTVGFDSIISTKKPISSDTVFNHPEMWFPNTTQPQAFIFLNLQGKIDSTAKADGPADEMAQFTYKIGSSVNAKPVNLPNENFLVTAHQTQYVHMIINYMKLFEGIDLSKANNLSVQNISDNSNALAKQIVNNIPIMFSYEF